MNRFIKRYICFKEAPVKSGMIYGVYIASLCILFVLFLWLFFVVLEMFGVDTRSVAAIAGFIVLPIIVLLGYPWSFWFMSHDEMALFGIFISLIVNAAIIGSLIGYWIKLKNQKQLG